MRICIISVFVISITSLLAFNMQNQFNSIDGTRTSIGSTTFQYMNDEIDKLWREFEKLFKQHHLGDAQKKLSEIAELADELSLRDHQIKVTLYHALIYEQLHKGNNLELYISKLDSMRNASVDRDIKSILNVYLAQAYSIYFANYRSYNANIPNVDENEGDYRTWSSEVMVEKIFDLCFSALENKGMQEIDISDYSAIISKIESNRLRSMYDVLIYETIEMLLDSRLKVNDFSMSELLRSTSLFSPLEEFGQIRFPSGEENDLAKFFTIYQQYLLNLPKENEQYVAYSDIRRLNLIERLYEGDNTSELLFKASKYLQEKYKSTPADTVASEFYVSQFLSEYTFNDDIPQEMIFQRHMEFYKSVEHFHSPTIKTSYEYERRGEFGFQIEEYALPTQPILAQVSHINMESIHYEIYEVENSEFLLKNQYNRDNLKTFLQSHSPIKNVQVALPQEKGIHLKNAEIIIDGLEIGTYLVRVSGKAINQARVPNDIYSFIYVTSARLISHRGSKQFLFVNAQSGKPISNISYVLKENKYNRVLKESELIKIAAGSTNANGVLDLKNMQRYQSYTCFVIENGKQIYVGNVNDYRDNNYKQKDQEVVEIFTDRAIYRPGQVLYAKFWNFTKSSKNATANILSNQTLNVRLLDANNQVVTSKVLKTDTYGTAHTEFVLPDGLLPGVWQLTVDDKNYYSFRVEEYKRPTFEITLDEPTGSITLQKPIRITGKVIAFAGYPISDAEVVIRVAKSMYVFPGYFTKRYFPQVDNEIIFRTTVQTDENGIFSFEIPPYLKNIDHYLNYEITADVTDISGETHTESLNLHVGKSPITVTISEQGKPQMENKVTFTVHTVNAVGKSLNENVDVSIFRLKGNALLTKRMWNYPDSILMTKKQFNKKLPHISYEHTEEFENLEVKEQVAAYAQVSTPYQSGSLNLGAGIYKIVVNHPLLEAPSVQFLQVYSKESPYLLANEIFLLSEQSRYKVGDTATIDILAPKDWNMQLTMLDRNGEVTYKKWIGRNNRRISIPISQSNLGGISAHIFAVQNNRIYTESINVPVPYEDFALNIEPLEIDSIIKPGSKTNWKFRITDSNHQPISGRVTATLFDASLETFVQHNWELQLFNETSGYSNMATSSNFNVSNMLSSGNTQIDYPSFNWDNGSRLIEILPSYHNLYPMVAMQRSDASTMSLESNVKMKSYDAVHPSEVSKKGGEFEIDESNNKENREVSLRENLKELVFFYPELQADKNGIVDISFIMNEAMTNWKLMLFGHSIDMKYGFLTETVKTQKEVIIVPQVPRFLREKDEISFGGKIVNNTNEADVYEVSIFLINQLTGEDVTLQFGISDQTQRIELQGNAQKTFQWTMKIPSAGEYPYIKYQFIAEGNKFSDAIVDKIPVLTNRVLVTENKAFYVRSGKKKVIEFTDFLKHNDSPSLEHQSLSLQYTASPTWEIVKALSYLNFDKVTTTSLVESIYSRITARNILAQYPEIKRVFDQWEQAGDMSSELVKNKDLLQSLIEKTPWVLEAQSEEEQRKSIAFLFNSNNVTQQLDIDIAKLMKAQNSDGGFPWIDGDSRQSSVYVTLHILNFLKKIDEHTPNNTYDKEFLKMIDSSLDYLDVWFQQKYEDWSKTKAEHLYASHSIIDYFLLKNMYDKDESMHEKIDTLVKVIYSKWADYAFPMRVKLAEYAFEVNLPEKQAILKSLQQSLTFDEELGAYYKGFLGHNYYSQGIVLNSQLLHLFGKIDPTADIIPELKLYILQHKRTNDWGATTTTLEVVNAFLNTQISESWLIQSGSQDIKWGPINIATEFSKNQTTEYTKNIPIEDIDDTYAQISIDNRSNSVSWGSLQWRYFEDISTIKSSEDRQPLSIERQYFKRMEAHNSEKFIPVNTKNLKVGDRVIVRVIVNTDRDMSYLHIEDFRPAGMEPVQVLSTFQYENGLSYYVVTRDETTDFYIERMKAGNYVFFYMLNVTQAGKFSGGISRIQSYYAPEMSSMSGGIIIETKKIN